MRAWNVALRMVVCLAASVGWAEKVDLKGTVVTWEGKPAAKADVHLIRIDLSTEKILHLSSSTYADEQGRFCFEGVELPDREWPSFGLQVVACAEGNSVGWTVPDASDPADVKVKLGPPGPFRGRVQDSVGKPIEGASVRLYGLTREWSTLGVSHVTPSVPIELTERWAVQTDKEGRFTLWRAPADAQPEGMIEKPGFCTMSCHWPEDMEISVTLPKSGTIRGQVRCADAKANLAGFRPSWTAEFRWGPGTVPAPRSKRAQEPTDAQGNFTLADVPPGKVRVNLHADPTSEWQPGGEKVAELAEGQVLDNIVLELNRGTRISGRVVDAETNEPLANAEISPRIKTDAQGRYSFYAAPGRLTVTAHKPGTEYGMTTTAPQEVTVRGEREVVVPDIRLTKWSTFQGRAVDESGRRVPGTVVSYAGDTGPRGRGGTVETNLYGEFRLPYPVGLQMRMALQARTERGFSEPLSVVLGKDTKPAALVVRESLAAKVKGRVVDDSGKPVANAIAILPPQELGAVGVTDRWSVSTDREGHFESPPLWPRVTYGLLNISAPGHKVSREFEWQTVPGKVHDLGDVVLQRIVGFLAGRLVDSKGQPLAGAKVWNSGDAQNRLETTTDEQGRFRLEGLETGFAYVFGEKDGYRLTGGRQPSPSEGVMLTLYRNGEAPPPRKLTPPKEMDTSQARRVALNVLDWELKVTEGAKDGRGQWERSRLIGLLVRIDPVRASEVVARQGVQSKGGLPMTMAEQLHKALGEQALARSVDEAIAHFNQMSDIEVRAGCLMDAACKAAKSEPEKAKALLRHALPALRGVTDIPHQTVALAVAGGLMTELGMPPGRELVDQAAEKAKNFALTGWEAYARGAVAEQLCERDLETALALVMPIQDERELARHVGNIAYRIAVQHPERAKALAHSIKERQNQEQTLARLCHRLAPLHLGQAEAMAESIREDPEYKARAYVWMAEQIADTDKPKACDYLGRAAQAIAKWADGQRLPDAPMALMDVARTAAKLGHPETPWIVLRALSLRPPIENVWAYERDARLAICLATVDAGAAKDFLEMLIPRILKMETDEDYARRHVPGEVAVAALMVEPALCERFIEELQKLNRPFSASSLCQYALGDAKQREEVVSRAFGMGRPDGDW